MGNLVTAWHNRTPLIVTAGQQTREMLLMEPRLASRRPTELPQPYVKWATSRRGRRTYRRRSCGRTRRRLQPPAGPVFLSLPLDDWAASRPDPPPQVRTVATRVAPDPARLREFAEVLAASRNPVLVSARRWTAPRRWRAAVALAERLAAPVWSAPAPERAAFPEDHPHFRGVLPYAIGPLAETLHGHDMVLVVGAPVFRYYPYVPGDHLPAGARLLHVTDDPDEAARAPVGDSLLGDAGLTLAALVDLLPAADRPAARAPARHRRPRRPVTA